ncbi:hypothetical protein L2E82_03282 [Cichorium intybus]|uniref:Uncharacterized protein n=1 Tax=Cichorium intybus TaxID=13427 RepID=A0ACB9H4R8_CICIN|nr:hypothetical protein L2E82_03282 [Cichorium intybus]
MAAASNPSVIALDKAALSKTVQQMAIDGDEPPPTYTVKDHKFGALETSAPSAPIPIIDMTSFLSPSSPDQEESELIKLRSALTTWGCFQAVNHGISSLVLQNVRQVIGEFFERPTEEKRKYSRKPGSAEGYGPDAVVTDNQVLDWCDRFSLRIFPACQRNANLWPENPSSFRETIEDYGSKILSTKAVLFKAIAKSLHLNEDCFSRVFTEDGAIMQGRFILYPPCPTPDRVYGLKPHTDRSGMTVLLQDTEVEGLQVLSNNKWFTVPLIHDALFVNLGDQLQIMSNAIYKSPMHRVVTNAQRGKISIAMFDEPDPNKEIGPIEALVDETRPRLYKTVKNYGFFNYECFQKGIVAIDAAKI